MAIPESQLQTWSHQGSVAQSSDTYNVIKNALEAKSTPYFGKGFKVFLQGSYGNDTNIYAESDVDIVIRLDDSFYRDLTKLTEEERSAYKNAHSDAEYTLTEFKRDVLSVLTAQYGSAVKEGDKAITVDAGGSRRKADVIVASQYRRYTRFRSNSDSAYVEGICFYNAAVEQIINYPKQHAFNLTAKHQTTSQRLKPAIRIFKNMRERAVKKGLIKPGTAPSYYIEGLLYNAPNGKFASSLQERVASVVDWYRAEAVKSDLVCANNEYYLLRDGFHTCWPQANCDAFIQAVVELWENW